MAGVGDIESKEVNVKLGGRFVSADLSKGYVQVATGTGTPLFVKEAFANVAKQELVEPIGKGRRFVSKARLSPKVAYSVALAVRFIGTSGQLVQATTIDSQEVVEYFQYVRPITNYAPALLAVINVIKELENRGLPWRAIVIAYPPHKKAKVLYVRGIKAYIGKYRTKSGVKQYPQVFLYFNQHVIGGLKKRKPYTFDLLVLYATTPAKPAKVKKWKEELAEAEASARSIPPPQVILTPTPPSTGVRARYRARAVEAPASPTSVELMPQQPTAVPAQAPAPQPATVDVGKYVKKEQPTPQPPQPATIGTNMHYVSSAEGGGETRNHYVSSVEETERELNEIYQDLTQINNGDIEGAIKKLREAAKHLNL